MNTPQEEQTLNSAYNPFPEPQTIPAGWDFSGLASQPQTDLALDEEESPES